MQRNQTIEPTSRDSATAGQAGANGPQRPGCWTSVESGAVSQCEQQHTLKYLLADQGQLKVCSDYISNIPGSIAYEHPEETRNRG